MQCTATTTKGERCKREAADGAELCELHATILGSPQGGEPVDDGPLPYAISATYSEAAQDPLVRTVLKAHDLLVAGYWGDDEDRMAHDVVRLLKTAGGSLRDLDFLVEQAALPTWTVGFWRGARYPTERPNRETVTTDSGEIPVWTAPT